MKGPIKLGSLFKGRGTKKIKMHTVKINFKTIPLFIENENRIMERKQILHTHEVFQNEKKKTVYQEDYMNIMFDRLYQNKRNYSFERPRVEDFSKEKKIYLKSSNESMSTIYITNIVQYLMSRDRSQQNRRASERRKDGRTY